MKLKLILFLLLVLGGFGFLIFNAQTSEQTSKACPKINATDQTVVMKEDAFEPATLTTQKCTKVIFKNQDKVSRWPASNLHPTHGIYPEFDPQQPIEVGQDWSFVFDKLGSWRYHDHLSPSIRGTISVSE